MGKCSISYFLIHFSGSLASASHAAAPPLSPALSIMKNEAKNALHYPKIEKWKRIFIRTYVYGKKIDLNMQIGQLTLIGSFQHELIFICIQCSNIGIFPLHCMYVHISMSYASFFSTFYPLAFDRTIPLQFYSFSVIITGVCIQLFRWCCC